MKKSETGYSIIELMVVVTLLVTMAISASYLLFTSLGGSGKASNLAVVKQSGDQAVQFIERQIRGAGNVSCPGADRLSVTDQSGVTREFQVVNDGSIDRLAYSGPIYITSGELVASNFTCSLTATGNPREPDIVDIQFTLTRAPGGRPSETATETFRTRTSLRTY